MSNHGAKARVIGVAVAALGLFGAAVPAASAAPASPVQARAGSGGWAIQPTPNPLVKRGQLAGISCTSPTACTAVGAADGKSGFAATLAEAWDGTSWSIQKTPNPVGAGNSVLSGVACTAATACIAVGNHVNGAGRQAALAEAWNGTTWSILPVPSPVGARGGALFGVSCPSATACVAVGNYRNASGAHVPLAEVWNGTAWSVLSAPSPAKASRSYLNGVSCPSATACVAVGNYRNGSGKHVTLAEAWNGTTWSIQPTPNPASPSRPALAGVSCTSPSACIAVGGYHLGTGGFHTLAEVWNGTTWSIQATPSPAATSVLTGVSCLSASDCTAAGSSEPNDVLTGVGTLAEAWDGTSWSVQSTPNPSNLTTSGLDGVSCTSPSACRAVGSYHSYSGVDVTLGEAWNGTAWSIQKTPSPAGPITSLLLGVSCPSPSACTAVGFRDNNSGGEVTLAEAWNGTAWSIQKTPSPAGSIQSRLLGVSCTSASACTAVGVYENGSFTRSTLAEAWNGTAWSIQSTPNPAGNDSMLLGVSCTSASACTAVGVGNSGFGTLAEAWDGTAWSIQQTPSPTGSSLLSGVSCTSPSACTAVGDSLLGTLAEAWDGTAWSVQSTPNPAGSGYFSGVSCTSPSACTAVGIVGAGNPLTLAEVWNGTAWSIQKTPSPTGFSFLSGVSCTSPSACTAVGNSPLGTLAEAWNGTAWSIQKTPSPAGSSGGFLSGVACTVPSGCTAVGSYVSGGGIDLTLAESRS
jgi:hypothetical protein